MIYTLTLNPSLDYVLTLKEVVPAEINRADSTYITYGGKGINVSAVLNELEVKNTALVTVAGFTGEELIKLLTKNGIKNESILLDGQTRINVKIKEKCETDINADGPAVTEKALSIIFGKVSKLKKDDILVLSGSTPKSNSKDIYEKIAKSTKAKVFADCEGEALLNLLKANPYLIKPNLKEVETSLNVSVNTEEEIKNALKLLINKGAQNVLCSMGENGAVLLTKDGEYIKQKAPKGNVINTTGAGDSMLAGFIAAHVLDCGLKDCIKNAVAAGSATAFSQGLAKRQDILNCMAAL